MGQPTAENLSLTNEDVRAEMHARLGAHLPFSAKG